MVNLTDAKLDTIVVDAPEGQQGPLRRIQYVRESKAKGWGVDFDLAELRDEHNQFAGIRYLDEIRLPTPDERKEWKGT